MLQRRPSAHVVSSHAEMTVCRNVSPIDAHVASCTHTSQAASLNLPISGARDNLELAEAREIRVVKSPLCANCVAFGYSVGPLGLRDSNSQLSTFDEC